MSRKTGQSKTETRRRGAYSRWGQLFKRLFVVAAVLVVGFLVWRNWDKLAPEVLLDWTDQMFGEAETGEGFPCGISGNDVVDMTEVNRHLVVVSDATLRFYNASAACVVERGHSFASPVLHTAGKYVLLTEPGSSAIRLDTRRETVLDTKLENRTVYTADVQSDGTVVMVLNSTSQSYLSEVALMNTAGEMTFTYPSSKYLLTDAALTPNGREIVAVGTTASNGLLQSVLLKITVSSGEVEEYTGGDVLLHTVKAFSNGTVLALGDNEIWALPENADRPTVTACSGFEPVGCAATSSLFSVAMHRAGSTDVGEVWIYNNRGERVQQVAYEGTCRSLTGEGGTVVLLTDRALYEMTKEGLRETYAAPTDGLRAVVYRDNPLLLTLSELKRPDKV